MFPDISIGMRAGLSRFDRMFFENMQADPEGWIAKTTFTKDT
jgi:hypothetical protein